MAGKEATIIALDVGNLMYDQYRGTTEKVRRIDISVECIKLMLQQKIFNYKNHEVGLILFGTEEAEDGNTLYIQEITKVDLTFIRNAGEINTHEVPQMEGGDIFDVIDKSVDQLNEFVGTKKYEKKLFILTSGGGETSYNEKKIAKLINLIRRIDVKINFIAIDFIDKYDAEMDDPDDPEAFEQLQNMMLSGDDCQTAVQNQNQRMIYMMAQELRDHMRIFPGNVAFELYSQFHTKQVAARASFRGDLMLSPSLNIQCLIFKKTTEEKIPSLKKYSTVAAYSNQVGTNEVKNDSVFYIQDDPNMNPVEKENIIKGYQYGKQIVPIDSIMEEKMKFICPRQFMLLGFVDRASIPRNYYMSSVDMVVAIDTERSRKQISALISALIATRKVGIARFVGREKAAPKLVTLIPHKSKSYECFWMIQLPTAEDIRQFQFASLKKATPQQLQVVGQMIDEMDLCKEGEEEILKMKYVVNPTRQYFQQAIIHKAINQGEQIPPISPVILEYLRPEDRMNLSVIGEQLKNAFKFKKHDIKKVGEKKVFWKQLLENDKQQQDEEVMEVNVQEEELVQMMAKQKFGFDEKDEIIKEISTVTPLEDFKKMINEKRMDLVDTALVQIQKMIIQLIRDSVRQNFFEKAMECLKEMRKACISEDEADKFNGFLRSMKMNYKNNENEERFWSYLVKEGITLISKLENKKCQVELDEAAQFLNVQDERMHQQIDQIQNEEEELLAEID